MKSREGLLSFLLTKVQEYNTPDFIPHDPISIPHQFTEKADIEIAAFLSATIAWGNRKSILKNGNALMALLGHSPHEFVLAYQEKSPAYFQGFVHRTCNAEDMHTLILGLHHIYTQYGGMEPIFNTYQTEDSLQIAITQFKRHFFETLGPSRTAKHISDPAKGSAAKRINMMLRWLVRKDANGVDFGIWNSIPMSKLSCPLDIHSGSVARALGLLERKQNDAKAVEELDATLRSLAPHDPVQFDFALFGIGAYGEEYGG